MLKKFLYITSLFFLIITNQIFSQNNLNNAQIIPLNSNLYNALDTLFYENGKTIPFANRPYTSDEYLMYLQSIENDSTSKSSNVTIQWIYTN